MVEPRDVIANALAKNAGDGKFGMEACYSDADSILTALAEHGKSAAPEGVRVFRSFCPDCEGDGLVVTGFNPEAYENDEGRCPRCKGTGQLDVIEVAALAGHATAAAPEGVRTIPLTVGGHIIVNEADRDALGLTYLQFEGTVPPDGDGVATLTEANRQALIAALAGHGIAPGELAALSRVVNLAAAARRLSAPINDGDRAAVYDQMWEAQRAVTDDDLTALRAVVERLGG